MEKEVNKALLMELKRHIWISVSLFDAMKLINIVQRNIFAAR